MTINIISRRKFLTCSGLVLGAIATNYLSPLQVVATTNTDQWIERCRPLMGSLVSIAITSNKTNPVQHQIIDHTFDYIESVINKISCWSNTSETGLLNANRELHNPSPEMLSLIASSNHIRTFSKGSFNHCNANLVKLWRDAKANSAAPTKQNIDFECMKGSTTTVQLANKKIHLTGNGTLEFGGIGKGFIADCAALFLKKNGIKFARVACSGDLRFIGNSSWIVDIKNPLKEGIIGSLELSGELAVSTSGKYETAWSVNGIEYHHLLDQFSGYPSTKVSSVTTIAPNCTLADGLATALFSMPPSESISLSSKIPNVEALIIDNAGKVFPTKNIKFQPEWKV